MPEILNIKIVDQSPAGRGTTAPGGSTTAPGIPGANRSNQGPKAPPIGGRPAAKPPELTPLELQEKRIAAVKGEIQAIAKRGLASIPGGAAIAGRAGNIAAIFGPVGIAAIAVATGLGAAAVAARAFANDVTKQIQALRGVSGPLAVSGAERDVELQLARLRRGQAIGGDLARIERQRTRREVALFDIGTEIREVLLSLSRVFEPIAEVLGNTLSLIAQFLEDTGPLLTFFLKIFVDNSFIGLLSKFSNFMNRILQIIGLADDPIPAGNDAKLGPFMEKFLQSMPGMFDGQAPAVRGVPLDANPFRNPLGV
jgi:hypothetical protein